MCALGTPRETVREILLQVPAILKGNITLGEARQYAESVQQAGGRVSIHEDGAFEDLPKTKPMVVRPFNHFTMCPQCGHKQAKSAACIRCGFLFDLLENT